MFSIGIDIGGTNIAGGVVSSDTALVCKRSVPFPGANNPYASIGACQGLIQALLEMANLPIEEIDAIGLAVPGSIDYKSCSVIDAHNLGYHDFPLVGLLGRHFPNTPIAIENDANAAAVAEYHFGAFKGYASGLLITLGTGVGAGLILDNKLFTGGKKNGFEFGHVILQFGGEPCTCGNLGCIEAYCSATALIRDGVAAAAGAPDCMIALQSNHDHTQIDAKLVIDCAKAGDPVALRLFDSYTAHLGAALASAIAAFDPEVIALGGGVSNAGEFLFDAVRAYVRPHAFFRNIGKIVPAQMGNDAGIVGAGMLHK